MKNDSNSTLFFNITQIAINERIANVAVLSPILVVGLFGNIAVASIVLNGKLSGQRSKSNAYVISLAIVDILFLLSGTLLNLLRYAYGSTQWLLPDFSCKIIVFIAYASANSAALIIACFSVERCLAVHFPLYLYRTMTLPKQLIIVAIAVLSSTSYSAIWLFRIDVSKENGECTYTEDRQGYHVLYFIDLTVFFIVPVLVMIVANSFIIFRIWCSEGVFISDDILSRRESNFKLKRKTSVTVSLRRNGSSVGNLTGGIKASQHRQSIIGGSGDSVVRNYTFFQ